MMMRRVVFAGTWILMVCTVLLTAQCSGGISQNTPAEAPPASASNVPPAGTSVIEDLVAANRVLADQEIVDGYGHVSVRNPDNPQRYFLSRSLAPELVTADDILELDLDSNVIDAQGRNSYQERFIHGEIYKLRPDVQSIVHMHAPAVIPFGTSNVPLRPMFHMSAFVGGGVPVFDIRKAAGMTNMLVSTAAIGHALAETLGDGPAVLMRGHGAVTVGPSLALAVGRSIYLKVNAELQMQAITLGGPITYLDPEEVRLTGTPDDYQRAWNLWKQRAVAGN
jgi:HCOMODA/2-hydroxy-3-carboxy-muconic semialdehyde decarboxylase